MTKTLFVIGSSGVIGHQLASSLTQDFDVHRFDLTLGHDMCDHSQVDNIFASTKCDALLNLFALNEHVGKVKQATSFNDFELQDVRKYMDVNVVALFDVCRTFIKYNAKGVVLNYSSIYGIEAPDNSLYGELSMKHIGYSVSKSAVIPLTRYFAKNAGPAYRFNCIAPGGVLADQPQSFVERYSHRTPLKRMCTVEDLIAPTLFFLTDQSKYITGAVLPVDGGFTIP